MNSNEMSELRSIWDEAKGHIERGDYDKAVEIYRYILIRYAENAVAVEYANAYLGDIFLATRRLDLAEKHLKRAISTASGNSSLSLPAGLYLLSKRTVGEGHDSVSEGD